MKKIYYLCYYDINNDEDRSYVLAATNKINYIISTFNKKNIGVRIISASMTRNKKRGYPARNIMLNPQTELKLFSTTPWGNKFQKLISLTSIKSKVLFSLLKLGKNDIVIVYHSLGYMSIVNLAHKIKGFNLILEVEEIYADVMENDKLRKKEIKSLQNASAYIVPTKLLKDVVNIHSKPSITIHGTYGVEYTRKKIFSDDKIHVVYAGTLDPRKGGAVAAVTATTFLPQNYHIHILGFGSDEDVRNMKVLCDDITKKAAATVTYDGVKSGEEYIQFIQSCDIGLSTQNPNAAFNGTSFPSKILSYMSNGLRVVSIRIPAIETSDIGDYMYYYEKQTPKEIAKAIQKVDLADDYDGRKIISELDSKFKIEISQMLEEI